MNASSFSLFNHRLKFRKVFIFAILLVTMLAGVKFVLANVSPDYLKNGRTYDQESSYIQWNGSVSYVSLYHRDSTSLPPSEGGARCNSGCTEQVTRIQNGGSVSGNFTYLQTFNVQVASTGDPATGTVTIRACGQIIATTSLYVPGASSAGFNNYPVPAWSVPTAGDCTWTISATGGYVDFRAVTTSYRSTPAPAVDLKVNASNGPLNLSSPAGYTLSWMSSNAAVCSASGSWSGNQITNGSQAYSNVGIGAYTYTITCTNPSGSTADSVTVNVLSAPTVTISAPASMTAPASYTATWTSSNAVSCSGSNRFTGSTGLSGSKAEIGLPAGTYDYTVTCSDAAGAQASDTKRTVVYAAPSVDLKVDGSDGPTVTRTGPVSYVATWTSANTTQCTGSSRLSGFSGTTGSRSETNVPAGSAYDYTVTCQNAAGATVGDTVRMVVVSAPTVDVKVNSSDGPLSFYEPAGFTVSWSSTNASSCSALNNLTGLIGISGSTQFSFVLQGVYRYTVQCSNAAGTTISDTVIVNVNPLPPTVDIKVENQDLSITRVNPASYTLSWTSQNAVTCLASSTDGSWAGSVPFSGSKSFTGVGVGTRTYSITCTNVSGSATDSILVVVVEPLSGSISALYAKLLLFGPTLGQPAQTLSGSSSGGEPPYQVTIHICTPHGIETIFSKNGSSWTLSPNTSGDVNLGVGEKGVWTAWAVIRDSAGRTYQTSSVIWEVSWYPVHGRP